MTQELRLIIPAEPPTGDLGELERRLVAAFGGYTVVKGIGAWREGPEGATVTEAVLVYDISAPAGSGGQGTLWTIAAWACGEFSQETVYIRGPVDGAQFVKGGPDPDPLSDPNSFKGPGPAPGGWHKHPKLTVPTRSEAAERAEAEAEFGPTPMIDALADAQAARPGPVPAMKALADANAATTKARGRPKGWKGRPFRFPPAQAQGLSDGGYWGIPDEPAFDDGT